MSLANKKCVPCQGGVPPLKGGDLKGFLEELGGGWVHVNEHHLVKTYTFENFVQSMAFSNKVANVSEEQGHHPEIHISYNTVMIELWTHKIDGLTESDFILAAKFDTLLGA
jgi:4a-hydroxytetrahydrobiopterin dehydratase